MQEEIQGLCPDGEECTLEDLLIKEIAVVDKGAVPKANNLILKGANTMAKEDEYIDEEKEEEEVDKSVEVIAKECIVLLGKVKDSSDALTEAMKSLKVLAKLETQEKADDDDDEDEEEEKEATADKSDSDEDIVDKVTKNVLKKLQEPQDVDITTLMKLYKDGYITDEELSELEV